MFENAQKKIGKFIKRYWTVLGLLAILAVLFVLGTILGLLGSGPGMVPEKQAKQKYGSSLNAIANAKKDGQVAAPRDGKAIEYGTFSSDNKARLFELESDAKALKGELIEISKKHEELLEKISRLDFALSDICSPSVAESPLDEKKILDAIGKKAGQLVLSGPAVNEAFVSLVEKYEKDPVRKAGYLLMADSFRRDIVGLAAYIASPPDMSVRKCRILAMNDELKMAAVDAGYMNGLRSGISLYGPDGARLKIVLCRPYVSAVLVTEGSFSDIAPGMEISLVSADK